MIDYESLAKQISEGEADYEVIYRIPAGDDYPWGDEVGFVEAEGWLFAVDFHREGGLTPKVAVEPGATGYFPAGTKWMITDNDAIDYGIEESEDE